MENKTCACEKCATEVRYKGRGRYPKYCPSCYTEIQKEQTKAWYANHAEERRDYMRTYMREYYRDQANYKQHLVRMATNRLERAGKLTKQPICAHCGAPEQLELHHHTYHGEYAKWLVLTLCKACHEQLHAAKDKSKIHSQKISCIVGKETAT